MEKEILNYQFSIFGPFESIYNNISEFINLFEDYTTREIQRDIYQNGIFNLYVLSKENNSIIVHMNRIDFTFNKFSEENLCVFSDFLKKVFEFTNKSIISRVAINCNCFLFDKSFNIINSICDKLAPFNKKDPSEFSIRINNTFKADNLNFNDIITIQKGKVQKRDNFESIDVLLLLLDINCTEIVSGFLDFDCIIDSFKTMLDHLNGRLSEFDVFLGAK